MKSLFVHDRADLEAGVPGGVQLCSREFLAIVRAASEAVSTFAVAVSRGPAQRLRRRLHLGSYLHYDPASVEDALARALGEFAPSHVFLNRAELVRLAAVVRKHAPRARVVIMSHGNQSGDDLYEAAGPRGRRSRGLRRLGAVWKLGSDLVTESWHRRRFVDAVAVMSQEEAVLERWLGTPQVVVLPRLIERSPVEWAPRAGRCGYVGTLDHTPNLVALEEVCRALQERGGAPELRLVGAPREAGDALARRFPFITYLGPLSPTELRAELPGWSLFLNPILWLSRGASMKLGMALASGLPVLSTRSGARGYEWSDGDVPTCADSPAEFADRIHRLLQSPDELQAAKAGCDRAALSAPTLPELAGRLRRAIA